MDTQKKNLLLAMGTSALLVSTGAYAQPDRGANSSSIAQPPSAVAAPPDSRTSDGYFFNLRPLGLSLGQALAAKGIYITGRSVDEGYANVSGGLKRGGLYEGFTSLGVDLDMNRIVGIKGGSIHFLANDLSGSPYVGYSGSAYAFNRVYSISSGLRLNEFSYEQSLFNNALDLRIGRVPVGTEFDYSDTYCQFVTGLCAAPGAFAFAKGYPPYLVASYGAVARVKLPSSFYMNLAVYEDQPSLSTKGHYSWPGEDWSFGQAKGATIPVQFGYRTTYATARYPSSFSIGGLYDTLSYNDPVRNVSAQNRLLSGGAAMVDHGKSQIWLQAEQVIWRPRLDTQQRGLTLFGGANFTTSGEPNIKNAYFIGFSLRGLVAARPNDTINFQAQRLDLNPLFTESVDAKFKLQKLGGKASSSETFFEVNYGLALAPGIVLKPFLQYIINPDQAGIANPSPANKHALFVGSMLVISFSEALGLPRMPKPGAY